MKLYDSQFYEVTFNNSDFAYQQAKLLPKIVSFLTSTRWWRSTIKFYPSIHPSVQPGVEQGWQRDRASRTWWSIKNSSRPAYHTEHWKSFSRKSQLPPISTDVGGPDSGLLRSIFNHVGLLLLKCNPAAVAVLPITCAVEKFKEGRSKFRVCVCQKKERIFCQLTRWRPITDGFGPCCWWGVTCSGWSGLMMRLATSQIDLDAVDKRTDGPALVTGFWNLRQVYN